MMQPVSAEIAAAARKCKNAAFIDPVEHGEVTFTIRHGKVTQVKLLLSVLNQETA